MRNPWGKPLETKVESTGINGILPYSLFPISIRFSYTLKINQR